jgi:hypothetical protein
LDVLLKSRIKLNYQTEVIANYDREQLQDPMKKHSKHQIWQLGFSSTIVLVSLNSLGIQAIAQPTYDSHVLLSQNANSSTPNLSALEIFRQAYENRYTWNPQFPGYTAAVEFKYGQETHKGNIRVNSDMSVEVTGISNEQARQNVENSLRMMVVHRRRVPFEQEHNNKTFKLGATDNNGAVEIFEQGEKTEAKYKISNRQLIQVNRTLGNSAVTVDTLDTKNTPEGYLATHYRTTSRQLQTKQIVGEEESEDTYNKIGDYYLLQKQVLRAFQGGKVIDSAELNFSDIKLNS